MHDPIAYFITWTVYGTHLQGAETGWRKSGGEQKLSEPALEIWHKQRLTYQIQLLNKLQRKIVENAVEAHCQHRLWQLWKCNARSNHVHAVVTAKSHRGNIVRDQLKANCTRCLREKSTVFRDRPVWTEGGDWQCINSEDELQQVIEYVEIAQDRKDRDEQN
jgi:REP element-mobilizing transposase RayT